MRLDSYLFQNGYYNSRTKASENIKKGLVLYDGKIVKPSQEIDDFSKVEILTESVSFVSNGGYKLSKALNDFDFSVKDMVFADIGASNGGFTDCLIKNGAKKVYAIDVGENQLDKSLDFSKIVVLDNTNARYIDHTTLGEKVDGVVCDVSFISLKLILPTVKKLLKENGVAILLIKPQFECGKEYLGNSGIVKSKNVRVKVCLDIYDYILNLEMTPLDLTFAPLKEKKNIEYIIFIKNGVENAISKENLLQKII